MARRRFTREERAAFTIGARVEWRNGRHWHPATVTGDRDSDSLGWEYVPVKTTASRGSVIRGEVIHGYPGAVRLPA